MSEPPHVRFAGLDGIVCVADAAPALAASAIADDRARVPPRAVMRRRQDFLAGRGAARLALDAFGLTDAPLPRAPGGAVSWPTGVVGSVAHCRGFAAAAVALGSAWKGLGVDVEPDDPLPADATGVALNEDDRAFRETCDPVASEDWTRMQFCAKECVHKCLHPLRGAWLEFDDVAIRIDDREGARFTPVARSAAAAQAFAGLRFEGRWRRAGGYWLVILAAA